MDNYRIVISPKITQATPDSLPESGMKEIEMNEKRAKVVAAEGFFGRRESDDVLGGVGQQAASAQRQGASATDSNPISPTDTAKKILAADAEHRSLSADQALMLNMVMPYADNVFGQLSEGAYHWFEHQGFWPNVVETMESARMKKTEKLALVMTEVAECIEAVRKDDSANEEEEIADIFVRLFDYCGRYRINIAAAYQRKMITNLSRPFRHGKKF